MKINRMILLGIILTLCVCRAGAQEYTMVDGQKRFADLADWGAYSGGEFSFGVGLAQSPSGPRGGGDYAKSGVAVSASALVDMKPFLASGAEYAYAGYRTPAAVRGTEYMLEAQEVFGAFKFKWSPAERVRLYVPVGLGAAWLRLTQRRGDMEFIRDKWAFAAYAGVGVEADVTPSFSLGLEYRYVQPFIQTADLDPLNGSSRYFQMHHVFLRLGKRFF